MRILFLFLAISLMACKATKQVHTATIDQNGYLVGIAQKSDFEKEPFKEWFSEEYTNYTLDMDIVNQLKPLLKDIKIKAVMGTWCGDSRRETPTFYKLLDAVDFDFKNLQMICVDRSKTSTNNEQADLEIERVPTFIFYKNGKELNRFVEYPRETLELDFLKIVQEVGYKHAYLE